MTATPNPTVAAAAAWQAVLARDARFDGRFVYGVRSTGVYCRPTCPSRRPAPRHVVFFDGSDAAERAGFRACKRCRPTAPLAPASAELERVRRLIDARADERLTLTRLATEAGLSAGRFQRAFTAAFGVSPSVYQRLARTERFKAEVRSGRSVTEALYEAGFSSGSRLYAEAARSLGMTPGAYRRGGHGTHIRYTLARSPLGRLLLAATDRGVCALFFGADDAALEASLRREYPRARLEQDPGALRDWLARVLKAIDTSAGADGVPLDLGGTTFQRRVWAELMRIPAGETRSYAQVAEGLDLPKGARAVAQACARNRVAVLVPCHRVVRLDGEPGGYRWGAARKRRLLRRERR